MKQTRDIIVIGSLFVVIAFVLGKIDFWNFIGLEDPKGLYVQGIMFMLLMYLFKNFIFGPFLTITQERSLQTEGKRKEAHEKKTQAEKMIEEYDDAITQARIKAVTTKQQIAMQAEEEERKTLEHARFVSSTHLKKELQDIQTQAVGVEKDLEKDLENIANEICNQVFKRQESATS